MSELRQDLVSGDWIIVAPERAGRPHWLAKKPARRPAPKSKCPFENLRKSGNWPPILAYPNEKAWKIVLIPNKYPALKHANVCAKLFKRGPYSIKTGVGHHDLLIARDHSKNFAALEPGLALKLLQILQKRYTMLYKDKCNAYTSVFFNWGPTAGASVYHPHYQILTLPIIPPDVEHSLSGSERYFKKHKKCVHCVMLDFDKKEKVRIIEQNDSSIAVAPFFSREPFEVRIFPKKHLPNFERTPTKVLKDISAILQSALRRIKKYLNDPDFNFFIHTAPIKDNDKYGYYHWHIEILPKISMLGGFELGTGVDINVVDPAYAADVLRGNK
jgi:UDPglucose--hexose-1-phosphate uridylyltransferase